jgi:dUTP pyrophosphatase
MPPDHALTLRFRALSPHAGVPEYQSAHAAGMDLAACLEGGESHAGIVVEPVVRGGRPVLVGCGFAMALPEGYEAQVRPRSGLAVKLGVTVANAPGTIDADYRGEVRVALVNLGPEAYVVKHGARIAQMVIARVERARVVEVLELDETERSTGGFGSTGEA